MYLFSCSAGKVLLKLNSTSWLRAPFGSKLLTVHPNFNHAQSSIPNPPVRLNILWDEKKPAFQRATDSEVDCSKLRCSNKHPTETKEGNFLIAFSLSLYCSKAKGKNSPNFFCSSPSEGIFCGDFSELINDKAREMSSNAFTL